ncbi:MAG: hypothetical protein R2790_02145 [Flavobacterium haoranii]
MEYYKLTANLSKNPKALDFTNVLNYSDFEIRKINSDIENEIVFKDNFKIEVDTDSGKNELDYNLSYQGLVIVSQKLKSILENENVNIQFIKIDVTNLELRNEYYAIKLVDFLDCVDETKSEFEYYPSDNILKKDKYKNLKRYYIDSTKVGKSKIFRLIKYFPQIIITEDLKKVFEENKITGLEYHTTWE